MTLAFVLGWLGLFGLSSSVGTPPAGRFVTGLETRERVVALSFDDGPAPGVADSLLALLRARHASATFFLVGEEAAAHREEALKLVRAGEDVENHTWTHPQLDTLDEARIRGELDRTERLLDTLGARPRRLMRPPYGVTEGALQQTLRHTHRAGMLWDVDPDDDPDPVMSIPDILATAMRQLHPGGVILLHPWYPENVATRAALPMLLDSLEGRGYRVVSLEQMARLHHARWRQAP